MTERILMPLDGSKLGEAAIDNINTLISKFSPEEKVEIILLHVIRDRHSIHLQGGVGMMSVPYSDDELVGLKDKTRLYLEEVSKRLHGPQVTVTCIVSASEKPVDEILRMKKEVNADLIAMSTHGRGGFSRFNIGSVADRVMRGSSIPVMIVRAQEVKDSE